MADFATYTLAETRAKAKVADGTWIMAHAGRATIGGKICVRVQRKMTAALTQGGWVEITDNGTA